MGRGVIPRLLDDGYTVIAVSRTESIEKIQPQGHPKLTVVPMNPIEEPLTKLEDHNPDAIVNLIGILRERGKATFKRIHVEFVKKLVEFAKDCGVRKLVHVSANGVKREGTPYQKSKWEGEEIVQKSGLNYTILRPSIILGHDPAVYNFLQVVDRLLKMPVVPLIGGGGFRLQPVSRERVSDTITMALKNSKFDGKTIKLCGERILTMGDILRERAREKGLMRVFLPIPLSPISFFAKIMGRFSWFPITTDEIRMLVEGNVCNSEIDNGKPQSSVN